MGGIGREGGDNDGGGLGLDAGVREREDGDGMGTRIDDDRGGFGLTTGLLERGRWWADRRVVVSLDSERVGAGESARVELVVVLAAIGGGCRG